MTERIARLRKEWDERPKRLGSRPRSVLCQRFPAWLNRRIHDAHVAFCLRHRHTDTTAALDVGCGYGRISFELKRQRPYIGFVQAIDRAAIAHAQVHNPEKNIDYVRMNALQTGFPDTLFDIVVCNQMYEHGPDAATLFDEIWRVLKPGGHVIPGPPIASRSSKHTTVAPLPVLSTQTPGASLSALARQRRRLLRDFVHLLGLKRIIHRFRVVDYT